MKKIWIIVGILIILIGASCILLKVTNSNIFKRLGASVVDSVPSGSLITDTEFYAELVDCYNAEKGTTYDYTHNFTTTELASLETLVIDENGNNYHGHSVESLAGLSFLTGLKNLTLKNMNVTSVDLSSNTNLLKLIISNVKLAELNVKNNTKLKQLNIDTNTIEILNLGDTNLEGISLSKPTTVGKILMGKGKTVPYLLSASTANDNTVKEDSFTILCDKYDLNLGQSATCYVKGNPTFKISGLVFKMVKNNNNIEIGNVQKLTSMDSVGKDYLYFGEQEAGEFNIISFTVTAISSGSSTISLTSYDSNNPIGYLNYETDLFVPFNDNVSRTFYIDKTSIKNKDSAVVTSGNLKTNYSYNIIGTDGAYTKAYDIAVLGDVLADGIINIQDASKAYKALALHKYSTFTSIETAALDANNDGSYSGGDIIRICTQIGE